MKKKRFSVEQIVAVLKQHELGMSMADIRIDFNRPAKPTDNAYVESFNGSLRDECLNMHWFEFLEEAREIIESWRIDYNESRPHMALGNIPPAEYAALAGVSTNRGGS